MKGRREGGIALVIVLWVITLLAVMATSFAISMRTEARLTRNLMEVAQARYLAEAGVQRALLSLLDPDPARRWQVDGSVQEWVMGEATVRIAIFDERGKIDLNAAPPGLLDGLLKSLGVDDEARTALIDAILDWRDPDQLRRLNGAEDEEYRAAGLPYGAKDAPFASVEELPLVLGMTPDLFQALKPLVTVHSHRAAVNPQVASRPVLLALPGSSPEQVDAYLAARDANQAQSAIGRSAPLRRGRTYSVVAEARLPSGTSVALKVTVRLGIRPNWPFSTLEWKEGDARLF